MKSRKKRQGYFLSFGLGRPPPAKLDENFWIRACIYVIVVVETVSRLNSSCVSLSSQSHQIPDVRQCYIYVHRYVKKLNLNFKVASLLPEIFKYFVEIRRHLR